MKTTIELPDALVREVKLRALHQGRKLKEVMAELLRKGLDAPGTPEQTIGSSSFDLDERSGLPVVRCKHPARSRQELSPDRVGEILHEQEARWHHDASAGR